ncbi:MAG: hypothetical protein CSA21_08240 [Deltaproteobacteria bacterium]|nr:MAG: hypothetical protein CSA21_08240 [Deltaproteobacteria bacterium]
MKKTARYPILFRGFQGLQKRQETLAREICLSLHVRGQGHFFITCSPGQERHLVLGRLRAEKLISDANQIQDMTFTYTNEEDVSIHVILNKEPVSKQEKESQPIQLQGALIFECVRQLEAKQILFPQTGCAHGAALFDQQGHLLAMAEDVARRSALEKAIGQTLEEKTLSQAVLAAITSRLNADLVTCAAAAGLTFLCGISVGTFAAMNAAKQHGLTLIGRVRGQGMNIYTGHERLIWGDA